MAKHAQHTYHACMLFLKFYPEVLACVNRFYYCYAYFYSRCLALERGICYRYCLIRLVHKTVDDWEDLACRNCARRDTCEILRNYYLPCFESTCPVRAWRPSSKHGRTRKLHDAGTNPCEMLVSILEFVFELKLSDHAKHLIIFNSPDNAVKLLTVTLIDHRVLDLVDIYGHNAYTEVRSYLDLCSRYFSYWLGKIADSYSACTLLEHLDTLFRWTDQINRCPYAYMWNSSLTPSVDTTHLKQYYAKNHSELRVILQEMLNIVQTLRQYYLAEENFQKIVKFIKG